MGCCGLWAAFGLYTELSSGLVASERSWSALLIFCSGDVVMYKKMRPGNAGAPHRKIIHLFIA